MFGAYRKEFPSEAESFERQIRGELPRDWDEIPLFKPRMGHRTRGSGKVLNAITKVPVY
jgi:transketolase